MKVILSDQTNEGKYRDIGPLKQKACGPHNIWARMAQLHSAPHDLVPFSVCHFC